MHASFREAFETFVIKLRFNHSAGFTTVNKDVMPSSLYYYCYMIV